MAGVMKNLVKETTTVTSTTSPLTLLGAKFGHRSFAIVGNGNPCKFKIFDPVTGAWEISYGVYTSSGTTLARTTLIDSSTGSVISFAAGTKEVSLVQSAEDFGFMGASAHHSATQTIPSAGIQIVVLDTEDYDTNAIHDPAVSSELFTIPVGGDGKWAGVGCVVWDTNTSGIRQMFWQKNGSPINGCEVRATAIASLAQQLSLPPIDVVAGNTLGLAVFQDSGTDRTLVADFINVTVWRVG
jgi:hypothetical protein